MPPQPYALGSFNRRGYAVVKGKPTPAQLDSLLNRLATDDAFREHVLGDPSSALQEYGLEVHPEALQKPRKLPSKEELQKSREAVKDKVGNNLGLIILLV
jgi:putative modified peptide